MRRQRDVVNLSASYSSTERTYVGQTGRGYYVDNRYVRHDRGEPIAMRAKRK
jgi:hypothetical protein